MLPESGERTVGAARRGHPTGGCHAEGVGSEVGARAKREARAFEKSDSFASCPPSPVVTVVLRSSNVSMSAWGSVGGQRAIGVWA